MIVKVPQLGEGLREIFIIRLLKLMGETVAEDEPLYEVETQKATVVIESPCSGILTRWYIGEGEHVAIGEPVAEISQQVATSKSDAIRVPHRISPRVRAWAQQRQISNELLETLAESMGGTLSEAALEQWCEAQREDPPVMDKPRAENYEEFPLSDAQRLLNRRGFGDSSLPVPATVKLAISWSLVQQALQVQTRQYPDLMLTEFQLIAYAAACAVRENPRFRCRLSGRDKLRQYNRLTIGFAVKRGRDELTTAIVSGADSLSFREFSAEVTSAMKQVIRGNAPPVDEATTLLISYMATYGITDAVPAIAAPAVAVLFVGAPQRFPEGELASLVLTFDHRIMNGVGAALYLQDIQKYLELLSIEESS